MDNQVASNNTFASSFLIKKMSFTRDSKFTLFIRYNIPLSNHLASYQFNSPDVRLPAVAI